MTESSSTGESHFLMFYGASKNGVLIQQICTTLIASLLLVYVKFKRKVRW